MARLIDFRRLNTAAKKMLSLTGIIYLLLMFLGLIFFDFSFFFEFAAVLTVVYIIIFFLIITSH